MAGVTDSPCRRIARRFGAGLLYSECISAEGVRRMGKASLELARFLPEERPILVQLFGSEPSQFSDAAAVLKERFQPDGLDINCGCPVKRFVTKSCGGWLMQDPDLIGRIVEAVRAVGLPVSVKLRSGYRKPDETAAQCARAAESAGAWLVAVHGRFVRGAKGTTADWDVIGRVKAAVNIPVVGNGDIFSYDDALHFRQATGCDRVMIARWAQGKPWIFAVLSVEHRNGERRNWERWNWERRLQSANILPPLRSRGGVRGGSEDELSAGTLVPPEQVEPDPAFKIDLLLEHYRLALDWYPERRAVNLMRKHVGWYLHAIPGAAKLRAEVMRMDVAEDVMELLYSFEKHLHRNTQPDTTEPIQELNFTQSIISG